MQYPRLEEALDQAALNGLLRYDESGNLIHVPFSLSPFSISQAELHEMQQLTEPFSEMMLRVSRDREFIREHLEPWLNRTLSWTCFSEWDSGKKHRLCSY